MRVWSSDAVGVDGCFFFFGETQHLLTRWFLWILVLARYGTSVGTIPGGWPYQTIWQNSDSYTYGGDSDIFNGDITGLKKLASG